MTKELLSEVYNEKVFKSEPTTPTILRMYYDEKFLPQEYIDINIHELAHKCKKWAWAKNYEIVERKTQVDVYKNNKRVAQFIGDSLVTFLPGRVYEACEWILEQRAKS